MPDAAAPKHQEIAEGAEGDEVKILQDALNEANNLVVDGVFGPKTVAALKLYQQANGLAPDGIAGKLTWEKLDPQK